MQTWSMSGFKQNLPRGNKLPLGIHIWMDSPLVLMRRIWNNAWHTCRETLSSSLISKLQMISALCSRNIACSYLWMNSSMRGSDWQHRRERPYSEREIVLWGTWVRLTNKASKVPNFHIRDELHKKTVGFRIVAGSPSVPLTTVSKWLTVALKATTLDVYWHWAWVVDGIPNLMHKTLCEYICSIMHISCWPVPLIEHTKMPQISRGAMAAKSRLFEYSNFLFFLEMVFVKK